MIFNRLVGQSILRGRTTPRGRFLGALCCCLGLLGRGLAAQDLPTTGEIVGLVSHGDTRQPVTGVRVSVDVNGTPRSAEADEHGRFRLSDIPVGTYLLLAAAPAYVPTLEADLVVTAGRQTQVMLTMVPGPRFSEDVVVQASAFSRTPDLATGTHTLSFEEIRRSPGGLGDVSRLMQSLPGVATSSDQRNDIVARGGSPSENLTMVDGIEVPNLNHFAAQGTSGGPISMLNADLIQSATFLAGGFPAAYGDRLSSVLDVSLREGSRERFEADIDLGFAGFGAVAEGPLGRHGSYLASARRSYLELLAPAFGLTAVPRYTNYLGKAVVDLSARHRLSFIGFGGTDRIAFDVDESDLDDPSLLNVTSSGWRATSSVQWRSLIGNHGIGTFAVSQTAATFRQAVQDTQIGNQTILDQNSREDTLSVQYGVTYRTSSIGTIRAGAVARRLGARLRLAQPIGLDNPYSIDETRVDAVRVATDVGTSQTSLHLQTTRQVSRWLDVTGGVRVDRAAFIDAVTVAPRMSVMVHLRSDLDLTASYGRYTQMPALVFLTADAINRELLPVRAEHRVAGVEWRPAAGLRVTIEGYQKEYRDYPVSLEHETLSLANTGDFYGVGGLLLPLVSEGRGRARGVEFFARQKLTRRIYGQLAYAHARAEHAARDGVLRRGAFDTPHVLSMVGGYRFDHRFEMSTKLTMSSGRVTTPFLLDVSRAQNRGVLDLTRVNAERGPAYQRWDVRMDRRYRLPWATLVTWMEVENLLGRKNVYQYVWNPKTRDRESLYQIGRFIVGGFTFEL